MKLTSDKDSKNYSVSEDIRLSWVRDVFASAKKGDGVRLRLSYAMSDDIVLRLTVDENCNADDVNVDDFIVALGEVAAKSRLMTFS